jgi:hypothetical protein
MFAAAFVCLLLVSPALSAANTASIDWWIIGGGGGSDQAGAISLDGTAGQWMAGSDTAGTTQLDSGFWSGCSQCGKAGPYSVLLPLVLRNESP